MIEIIKPKKEIFNLFDSIKKDVSKILDNISIELIGSLAVPMIGKKEIDILIQTNDIEDTQDKLKNIGFSKGPIINKEGFCINRDNDIVIEAHIVEFNDTKVKQYHNTIKRLQEDNKLREEFEKLKISLNGLELDEYKIKKNKFFKENKL